METASVKSAASPAKLYSIITPDYPFRHYPHQSTQDFYQARNKPIPIAFGQQLPASPSITSLSIAKVDYGARTKLPQ
jgi:hypothetical protein